MIGTTSCLELEAKSLGKFTLGCGRYRSIAAAKEAMRNVKATKHQRAQGKESLGAWKHIAEEAPDDVSDLIEEQFAGVLEA